MYVHTSWLTSGTKPLPNENSVAAAFTNVVTSFVSDIILPPLSVLLPLNANLDLKFAVLQAGANYQRWGGYNTIEQAQDDGAVIMAYGVFLNKIINFIGLGLALYSLAGLYQYLSKSGDPIIKHTVKCRYCKKKVIEEVSRAFFVATVVVVVRRTGSFSLYDR